MRTTANFRELRQLRPGNPVWVWNAFDYLDVNRHPMNFPPDWTHSNAVLYTSDGNLLLSMRHQSWILKIDYENGKGSGNVLWKLGYQGDFTLTNGGPIDWFYGQHYPSIISTNGSIMRLAVFDDGNNRVLDTAGDICGTTGNPDCYTRAAIYDVDQSTMTATLVWAYKPGFFTLWGGSINQLANGNVEFDMPAPNSLPGSRIMEVTQTAQPSTIWQMDLSVPTAYRGYRIPSLYPGVQW